MRGIPSLSAPSEIIDSQPGLPRILERAVAIGFVEITGIEAGVQLVVQRNHKADADVRIIRLEVGCSVRQDLVDPVPNHPTRTTPPEPLSRASIRATSSSLLRSKLRAYEVERARRAVEQPNAQLTLQLASGLRERRLRDVINCAAPVRLRVEQAARNCGSPAYDRFRTILRENENIELGPAPKKGKSIRVHFAVTPTEMKTGEEALRSAEHGKLTYGLAGPLSKLITDEVERLEADRR